jgi:very-short-patch-repair endonuclease
MIAQRQRGRVNRTQLLTAGITSGMIGRMVRNGWLYQEHNGVYAVGHPAPIELGRETAALLACCEAAVLSHLTAAALWKLRPPRRDDDPVDVLVPPGQHGSRNGIRFHRTRGLRRQDIRFFKGLPITSPARTLLDITGLVSERELERALDEGLVNRIVRAKEVRDVLARTRGRHGASLLANLLDGRAGSTVTRSQAEERFLALVRDAELPMPEVNARVHGYEVDFLWREQGVAVEVDGYRYHSTRSAFERDSAKGAKLTAAGLHVMRVTWLQMDHEPLAVVARLSQALVRAA